MAPDLRGYGDSAKPANNARSHPCAKRAMARDQVAVMQQLGFERFAVAGHDRGGRCAYRLALDRPERVRQLAVLDIVPTSEALRRADMAFALSYWHWFFLAQPADLPERLIQADPDALYLRRGGHLFAPDALAEYRRCFHDPATIHAMCEDYRAGATGLTTCVVVRSTAAITCPRKRRRRRTRNCTAFSPGRRRPAERRGWGRRPLALGMRPLWAVVGIPILIALTLWLLYRLGRGWLRLRDRQSMDSA